MRACSLIAVTALAFGCGAPSQAGPGSSAEPLEHDAGMAGHQGDVWVAGVMMYPPAEFVEMTEPPGFIPEETTILLRFEITDEASPWLGTLLLGYANPYRDPTAPSAEACLDLLNQYCPNHLGTRGGEHFLVDGRHACIKQEMVSDMPKEESVTAMVLERDRYLTFVLRQPGGMDWSVSVSVESERVMRAFIESIEFMEMPAE